MAKIAACLIVKNSAATIERAIDSIRLYVDEINIYDTGSTDGTVELLERLNEKKSQGFVKQTGLPVEDWDETLDVDAFQKVALDDHPHTAVALAPIRVQRGEWRDDFSWARQRSFEMASDDCDWLLWLDDDDEIVGAPNLRVFADRAPADLDGFVFQYDYAQDEAGNCVCVLWRERLIRKSAGYEWRGPVHEVLVPPDGKAPNFAGIPAEQCRYIHARPAGRYDPDRNLDILRKQAADAEAAGVPVDPRTLAYLGTEHMAKGAFAEALPFLERYLAHPDAGFGDERAQIHHKLATCLRSLGNVQAAVGCELAATAERDDWAENMIGLAQSFAMLGQWDRAERWAKRALEQGMPQSPLILNPLEFTLIPLTVIADAAINTGRSEEARAAITRALQIVPANEWIRAKHAEIERLVGENEIVGALMLLREVLVRHDENLKAWHLVSECVPYIVAERPEIVKARADQREMVLHYLRPAEYLRWYKDEPKESSLTDDHIDMVGEWLGRVAGLEQGLREQEAELGRKPRLLDLGCNDWWMGEYFARQGYRCDGVELNQRSYDLALERIERFGRDVTVVQGDLHDAAKLLNEAGEGLARGAVETVKYDAVSMFEVFEHVPDIEFTLDRIEDLVAPGGRVYLSTPNGAFEQGQLPGWAKVERKGHLRALPLSELAEVLSPRGEIVALGQTNGDRVGFAAYKPGRKKGRVVFYAGAGWEPWSPASINTTGLGGSETALVQVSARLAADGWDVRVYSGAEPGLYAGALWRPFTAWDPTDECDLLVVSRLAHVFDNPIGARQTALWCHDHSYPGILTEERAAKIDHVVVLSDWQRDRFARLYPWVEEKLTIIRNGITLNGIGEDDDRYPDADRPFADRKPRCVYSSSADRGLDVMLEVWPKIRDQVPDAELHVFYGFDILDRVAIANPGLLAYKQHVLKLAADAGGEDGGVFLRGRIGQKDLIEEMQQARVWSYPTAFMETSCIGAMEARASGLAIVTSDLAALAETVGDHGCLIPSPGGEEEPVNGSPVYKRRFVSQVVKALSDERAWKRMHLAARDGFDELSWDPRTEQWAALAAADTEAVAAGAVAA